MAVGYNSGTNSFYQAYPQQYPNYYYNNGQNVVATMPSTSNSILWVQGRAGAEAYPVAPGGKVMLMDSNEPILYVKSADTTGKPMPLVIYDLVERVETTEKETPVVAKAPEIDYEKIKAMIASEVSSQMSNLTVSSSLKAKKGAK